MKESYLVIGVVLLFAGIIGCGYTLSELDECGSLLGEIDQTLDEETQTYCDRLKIANFASISMGLVGVLLSIAGLIELTKDDNPSINR